MRALDIMSQMVCSTGPDTPINDIALMLCDHNISALPIVDAESRVLGIVSEGDLLRRVELGTERRISWLDIFVSSEAMAKDYTKTHGRTAKDVMTSPAIVVEESADVIDIAELLHDRKIKRVPVVRDGRLVGIVSRSDVVRSLIIAAKSWGRPREVDDESVRTAILDTIRRQPFFDSDTVNVVVENGEVRLWGHVESAAQHSAIRVIAENARGVRQVVDNLVEWRLPAHI